MEIAQALWEIVISGAPNALNAVLLSGIFYLLWEKKEIRQLLDEQNKTIEHIHKHYVESLEHLVDRYYSGNVELISTLKEIKIVLSTMQKHI